MTAVGVLSFEYTGESFVIKGRGIVYSAILTVNTDNGEIDKSSFSLVGVPVRDPFGALCRISGIETFADRRPLRNGTNVGLLLVPLAVAR